MANLVVSEQESLRASSNNRVVHVSLPASVYFNLDHFQKAQRDILGRLGCLACCSGWDIRYDLQRRFQVDEKLNVHELIEPLAIR